GAGGREIENVNGHLAFGINERNLNIALLHGKTRTDAIEQARPVLRDDLQNGAARRALVIKLNAGMNFDLVRAGHAAAPAVPQHAVKIGRSIQHIGNAFLKPLPLRQIEFQSAKAVYKVESVHHNSSS